MAITITSAKVVALNTGYAVADAAATSTVADTAEVFELATETADGRTVVILDNVSGANGSITYSVAAGDYWAGGTALTGTVEQGTKDAIVLEGGKYKDSDGKLAITVTPASGKKLLTDHAFVAKAIEIL